MKKKIAYWALYDFANSLVLISFLFYFSQWLVINQGRPAWWYNSSLILSSALFILTAPFVSRLIDRSGKKIGGLRFWTTISFISFAAVALIAMLSDNFDLLATVLYTIANYAYTVCFLYFTPMLNDLSNDENRSRVSGIGQGANAIGQVLGLLITLPFVNGAITLFGEAGRAQALLPAAALFLIFSLPIMILYKEEDGAIPKVITAIASPIASLKKVFSYKTMALLLIAYFLFSDALLTFANNFPLYLETLHGASDSLKAGLTMAILVLSGIGAVIFGRIADKRGEFKTLKLILLLWALLFPIMAFLPNLKALIPVFVVAGIIFGPVWGISRSLVGRYALKGFVASSYSYYVVAERFATFIGPAIWSLALISFGEGPAGYRAALLAMSGLLILGLIALSRIKNSP
ncbi:MAG: MFS transporter [Candidatus Harrisonbacteria bacterium]|nr:MFS transporter [Candidatus Harrisonbacteria bacterium]